MTFWIIFTIVAIAVGVSGFALSLDSGRYVLAVLILVLGTCIVGLGLYKIVQHEYALNTKYIQQLTELGVDGYVDLDKLRNDKFFTTESGTIYYIVDGQIHKK